MSKAQKGNKENKKPKADKNRVKGVGAKPGEAGQQPVRKKDLTQRLGASCQLAG